MRDVPNTIVHFYRATVMHADVWRRRLDVTTNWAVVSTAAIVTFAFSDPDHPHFILPLSIVFAAFFLVMESRRYQAFNLWRQRVEMLNRYIVAPALAPKSAPPPDEIESELAALAAELGSNVPHLSLVDALGYRLRRNYALLFAAVGATWVLKLWYHPTPAASFSELIDRAALGGMSGGAVTSIFGGMLGFSMFLAARARTEKMQDWTELPSPLRRALASDSRERETSLVSDAGPREFRRTPGPLTAVLRRDNDEPHSTD